MRILHVADLHLGRQFNGLSLEADHAAVLDQILAALTATQADLLIIAGDIFDRAAPPAAAVRQFNRFLSRLGAETGAALALIAGNHDSPDRIEMMAALPDRARALVRGSPDPGAPLVLTDAHGPVAVSALPFAYEYAAREALGEDGLDNPEAVLAAQLAAARRHLPPGARWVVVAHAFVAGGAATEGERPLTRVGGIETVSPAVFAGADYVALGHLHRPQTVTEAPLIRYAGAPLAFGLDEAGAAKSMTLIDLGPPGQITLAELPFTPPRAVRVLTGRHAELLAMPPSEDIIGAVLTDPAPVIDAMARLRAVFPNACGLSYSALAAPGHGPATTAPAPDDPEALVAAFVAQVREDPISEAEARVSRAALDRLARSEAEG